MGKALFRAHLLRYRDKAPSPILRSPKLKSLAYEVSVNIGNRAIYHVSRLSVVKLFYPPVFLAGSCLVNSPRAER